MSAHHSTVPNFLLVDGIFSTDTCKRFFPERTIAFRMEKCVITVDAVLRDATGDHCLNICVDGTGDEPRLTLRQIEQYFFQIFVALAYMHHLRIYHLDLKPSNILLTSPNGGNNNSQPVNDGEITTFRYRLGQKSYEMSLPKRIALVKIADLGSSMPNVSTYEQSISGTPAFRPPEYFLYGHSAPAGGCTDIWAIGLMMFEAYAGISHDDYIKNTFNDISEDLEDYLIECSLYIDTCRQCRMIYGYFVLFSTRQDMEIYRRSESVDEGWLAEAGAFAVNFVSLLVENDDFQEDWQRFSVHEGSDDAMIRLRSHLCEGDTNKNRPKLDAFLSMLSIDPDRRLSAGMLAVSPLFQHMAVSDEASIPAGKDVVCRLGGELFG